MILIIAVPLYMTEIVRFRMENSDTGTVSDLSQANITLYITANTTLYITAALYRYRDGILITLVHV